MTKYSLEVKLNAIQDYLDGVESYEGIAKKHQVNLTLLKQWVNKYKRHGDEAFQIAYEG
ncbi:transposase [Baia soyae]|uniref:Transposase n=1 Tax=Baia soyae TaxID=1544746 RepID=A0A4R2RQP2_9BACL|nr:transposase [Baia soyae]TCP62151.1 transposase [Baia soyae]